MLDFTLTRYSDSRQFPVATGSLITAEGQCLVNDLTDGVRKVKPATGTAADVFAGVSVGQQITITAFPGFESAVIGATYTLKRTPISGQILVTANGVALTATAGAPAAGEYSITDATITFNAAQAGAALQVVYRYVPTTVEAKQIQGDEPAGGAACLAIDQIGVITRGVVATTEFNAADAWTASSVVKTGANGLFSVSGNGTAVPGTIEQLPDGDSPFLVISINANP